MTLIRFVLVFDLPNERVAAVQRAEIKFLALAFDSCAALFGSISIPQIGSRTVVMLISGLPGRGLQFGDPGHAEARPLYLLIALGVAARGARKREAAARDAADAAVMGRAARVLKMRPKESAICSGPGGISIHCAKLEPSIECPWMHHVATRI